MHTCVYDSYLPKVLESVHYIASAGIHNTAAMATTQSFGATPPFKTTSVKSAHIATDRLGLLL